MNKLTFSQKIILECIKSYIKTYNVSPTLSELCEISNLKTKSTVHKHLKNLRDKGYIEIIPKTKRGIILIHDNY